MWYDTLESIERSYGCVAEYNRCMAERDFDMNDPCAHNMDDIEEAPQEPSTFEVGDTIRQADFYGIGVTYYTVEEIDRENGKILLAEYWENVDGSGTRPSEWHKLDTDDKGNERAFLWHSDKYDIDRYVFA